MDTEQGEMPSRPVTKEPKPFEFQRPHDERPYAEIDERSTTIQVKLAKRMDASDRGIIQTQIDVNTNIENRLADNDVKLQKLLDNGMDLIENIRTLSNDRAVIQRNKDKECSEELYRLIENERITNQSRLDVIMERWSELKDAQNDCIKLPELLAKQKHRIMEVIDEKDHVIQCHRDDLKSMEDVYNDFDEKQFNDSYFMIERMKMLLNLMRRSYQHHVELLNNTLEEERDNLFIAGKRKWEELSTKVKDNIEMKRNFETEKMEFFDKEFARIRLHHLETTRAVRIRLENDFQSVQMDLQQLKAYCLMNCEKFDYNYQMLQKKGDENVTIRNQEKRRLSQLREHVLSLRKRIRETKNKFETESRQVIKEMVRSHDAIVELEEKAERDAKVNNNKYEKIWNMNVDELTKLLNKVLSIDKTLYEQQLGLDWSEPDLQLLKQHRLQSYMAALQFISLDGGMDKQTKSLKDLAATSINPTASETDIRAPIEMKANFADTRAVRIILRRLSNETGFLVEDKLLEILKPYETSDRTLIQIDAVFKALGINHLKDVSMLFKFCLPYAWCPNCRRANTGTPIIANVKDTCIDNDDTIGRGLSRTAMKYHADSDTDLSHIQLEKTVETLFPSDDISISDAVNLDTYSIDTILGEYIEEFSKENRLIHAIETVKKKSKSIRIPPKPLSCFAHYLVIDPSILLKTLEEYTTLYLRQNACGVPMMTMADRLTKIHYSLARLLSDEDVDKYWRRFIEVFSKEKERLWAALEHGLKIYLKILQNRDKFDTECEFLRRQNTELRYLLSGYNNDNNNNYYQQQQK